MRVQGQSRLSACLVLELGTGLVRGVAVAATDGEALAQAFDAAVSQPTGTLPPGRPSSVLCGPGLAEPVAESLGAVTGGSPLPPITEVDPPAEAEDIFDSFIGHMAGRTQPEEGPGPEDWELGYAQALRFCRAAPWARWNDGIDLALEVTVGGSPTRHAAVVMGNAGLQHGLVLYPGEAVPPGLDEWQPGEPVPSPAGTLLCTLDRPGEVPAEMTAKALRYGWPPDAELTPVFLGLGPNAEGGDVGRADLQRLTLALAAVTAHDARGPVLTHPASEATTGKLALSGGEPGSFSIHQRPPANEPLSAHLRVHQAGFDLVPEGTPVVLGHLPWTSLVSLRSSARIHRPAPSNAPKPSGTEVPLLAVLPTRRQGELMAAQAAELDPYGVSVIETEDGEAVFTLVGANGAEVLMELAADSPSLSTFRRRLRETKGLHVVMIADESTTTRGKGTVYGLFECNQRLSPPRQRQSPKPSKPRPRGRRR
jgi:hypothetical protein